MSLEEEVREEEMPAAEAAGDEQPVAVGSQLLLVGAILLVIFGGGLWKLIGPEEREEAAAVSLPVVVDEQATDPAPSDPFADLRIIGDAAFVYDTKTQRVLYSHEPDVALPLASLTKLMTALLAYEILQDSDSVPISLDSLRQDGGSGFVAGESFSRATLTDLTLLSSSNDGAFALAEAAGDALSEGGGAATFVAAMNIKAHELELTNTSFRNPTGLDVSLTEPGAVGSARDMAFLLDHIITNYPELLAATTETARVYRSQSGAVYESHNTNQFVGEVPRIIGSKTGYTDLAGGNLAVAFDVAIDHPVIVVVLGSTRQGRFSDVETLISAVTAGVQ